MAATDLRLIHTTVEEVEQGYRLARRLVKKRLAACVSVEEQAVTSFYRWEGSLEETAEHALCAKTHRSRLEAAMQTLREHHPYDCPEILAVAVRDADPDYEAWVKKQTRPDGSP